MNDLIHHGNGNYKRRFSKCGEKEQSTDTTRIDDVTCILCVIKMSNDSTSKTRRLLWHERFLKLKDRK